MKIVDVNCLRLSLASAVVAASAFILPSCDNGANGSLDGCATALVGSYEGDMEGPISALISFEGDLIAFFVQRADNPDDERMFEGNATVDEAGVVAARGAGGLQISGNIDFDTCDVTGDWTLFGNLSGTWSVELRSPAGL